MAGTREESSDPRALLRQIWLRRWALVAIVVSIPAAVLLISLALPKTYEATATLEAPSAADASRVTGLIGTREFARRAARELDEETGSEGLADDVAAARILDDNARTTTTAGPALFTITATEDDAARAAGVANAYAEAYLANRREAIDLSIDNLERAIGTADGKRARLLQERLASVETRRENIDNSLVERAIPPQSATSPRPLANTAVALVFSLLLAGAFVVVAHAVDRSLRDPEALERLLRAPLLSTVPASAFGPVEPDAATREAFQTLRASLTYLHPDRPLRSLVVVSPAEADGNTTVAVNLAIAFAEADHDVVLIDADLRRSSIPARLRIAEPRYGLEDVLVHGKDLETALVDIDVDTEFGRLRVLSGGAPPASPPALLSSSAMRSLLAQFSERSGLVVIDTPPLLAVSDAIPLLAQTSGAVVVARLDRTRHDAVTRVREMVETAHGTVLGGVATGSGPGPFESELYAYGYGYGSDSREPEPERGAGARESGASEPGAMRRALDRLRDRLPGTGRA